MELRILLFAIAFSLSAKASSLKVKTYPPSEIDAVYAVAEVELLSALSLSGHRYRVVALLTGRENTELLPEDLRFESESRALGFKGFGSFAGLDGIETATPGVWKTFESSNLELGSIYLPTTPLRVQALSNQLVKYRGRLVKRCPVHLEREEKKDIVNDSSHGMISIPKLKTRVFTRVSKPQCYDPTDRTFELGTFETKEVAGEKLKSDAEEARRERDRDRAQLAAKIKGRLEHEAAELSKKVSAPTGTDFAARVKEALCPRTSSRARIAGIASFEFEKKLVESKKENGYTSNRYERTMTIRDRSGQSKRYEGFGGVDAAFEALRSLKLDASGCFAVELVGLGGYDERKVIREMESDIADYVERALLERASREALIQIPEI